MKFKKAFAWILAVAMVITLTPSMAFASSSNSSSRAPSVSADDRMNFVTTVNMKLNDAMPANTEQIIKLNFENVGWNDTFLGGVNESGYINNPCNYLDVSSDVGTDVGLRIITRNKSGLELGLTPDATIASGKIISLAFRANSLMSGSNEGEVIIAIDGMDSIFSSSNVTIATIGSTSTLASVSGTVNTFRRMTLDADRLDTTIQIVETAINSVGPGPHTITLKLPKGVEWVTVDCDGSMFNNAVDPVRVISNEGRTLTLTFTANGVGDVRETLNIRPTIRIGKEAKYGDITVELTGDDDISDMADLLIARYGEESVSVYSDDEDSIPTIYSGNLLDKKDRKFTVNITLDEDMAQALQEGRFVDFKLPDGVQICGSIKAILNGGTDAVLNNFLDYDNVGLPTDADTVGLNGVVNNSRGVNGFTFEVPAAGNVVVNGKRWKGDATNKITFIVPVTVRANYTGEIRMNVTGGKAGISDSDVLVAKAVSPITVTADITSGDAIDVVNGAQSQSAANITITENEPGYLREGADRRTDGHEIADVIIDIDTLGLENGIVFTAADVEVTDGNLEIKDVKVRDGYISFDIDNASTVASTISITGVVTALNRTLPEGKYTLQVYGDTLITNYMYDNYKYEHENGSVDAAEVTSYINIETPHEPGNESSKVISKFKLGEASYTVNDETHEMDAAPYLDENNRTMVPVRYAGYACGLKESDIVWYQGMQLAKLSGPNNVVTAKIGSNVLECTGMNDIVMDTVVVSDNGRLYVPIRYIANALNFDVEWDGETKTATFTSR